jgi:hypothetical protein
LNSSWGTSISIVYDQASFDEYFQEDRRAIDREPLSAFGLFENADIFAEMGRETSRAFPSVKRHFLKPRSADPAS